MGLSFTLKQPLEDKPSSGGPLKVLVTGAGGRIGTYFCEHAHERYNLRLLVHSEEDIDEVRQWGEPIVGDLGDLDFAKKACEGMDVVLHLAGDPSPEATWSSLLTNNVTATYHIFGAARHCKCAKVIFASSIHAVSGHPKEIQVKTSDPVNPGDLYGVSKCFGEALARYFAEQEGLATIALRIGAFQPIETPQNPGTLQLADAYLSHRDLQQLLERCVDDTRLQFAIFNALSGNAFNRLDISDAKELLGYAPQDNYFADNPALASTGISDKIMSHSRQDGQKSGIRKEVRL